VLAPRIPADDGKGDQLRAAQLIRALAADHAVEVLSFGDGATRLSRALGALGALVRGQPLQVGWMTPGRAWRVARRRAAGSDVVVAVTVRALRGPLPVPVILDHVDALSLNMRRRAAGPEPVPLRLVARAEAALLRRWERRLAGWVAAQAAISAVDAAHLPAPPEVQVLPNSVQLASGPPPQAVDRDIDVILTGNMAYPPNADAACWLSSEIAPALWRRRPDASVWVVGRDAHRLTLDRRIEVRADVPEVAAYLRRARIAVAPLRIGTGAPNKVLEAMAAGAAVVATPAAVAPFALGADVFGTADDAEAFAALVDRLLGDDALRLDRVAAGLRLVTAYGPEAQRQRVETLVATVLRD
jgi:glycosyltransferase involved in cell wall biosynthesis